METTLSNEIISQFKFCGQCLTVFNSFSDISDFDSKVCFVICFSFCNLFGWFLKYRKQIIYSQQTQMKVY